MSVADQQGATHEHIVQDNCSGPDVVAACSGAGGVRLFQEEDGGMYDAVNRGLRRSRGRLCAYLNCDEQYLPGTLERVRAFFADHPAVDVVFGDAVVVNAQGRYVCSRQVLPPLRFHTAVCQLNTFSGATFFRRRVFEEEGLWFDANWRNCGDAEWVLRLIRRGLKMATLGEYTTIFTETGDNLNLTPEGEKEAAALRLSVAAPVRWLGVAWTLHHRLRRALSGHYRPRDAKCLVYPYGGAKRVALPIGKSTSVWRSRMSWRR
jgi:glycosyltransferase involved in cell wall biosynthesis